MQIRFKQTLLGGALLAVLGISGAAVAESGTRNDDTAETRAFQASPVSLAQAIQAAQTETGAKAISAEFENEDGAWVYTVELSAADGSETEVDVSAQTGAILKNETEDNERGEE